MSRHSTFPTGGVHDGDATDIVNGTSDLMKRRYYRYLVEFLSFRDNVDYSLETEFSIEHLRSIQAHEVVRWLKKKVYDNPDPSPDDLPIQKPASLLQYKKALSYFMPDRDTVWHDATRSGNPTKSKEVQVLVNQVNKQSKQQDIQQHQERLNQARIQLNRIINPSSGTMTSAPSNNATPSHTSHSSTKNSSARKDRRKPAPKNSELDYTLELLEDQTDDPSVVRLLNNADVHGGNHHHAGGGGGGGGGEGIAQDQFRVLYREMLSLRKEVQSMKDEFKTDLLRLGSRFALDNLSARQSNPQQVPPPPYQAVPQPPSYVPYQYQPPVPMAAPPVGKPKKNGKKGKNSYIMPPSVEWQMQFAPAVSPIVDSRPATLCKHPKTLYVLWQEYMFGINGSKPAKDFTSSERGLDRYQYSRRKVVWDQIVTLMRSNYLYTANQAIEKIYNVYGIDTSLSEISNLIRIDQKERGGHPDLKDL